jgi:hypothetical protein
MRSYAQTISPGRWDATNNMAKMICNHCRTVYETDATATHCSCGGALAVLLLDPQPAYPSRLAHPAGLLGRGT